MQVGLCQLLRELVEADPMRKERLANVHVPWAYQSAQHVDFDAFKHHLSGSQFADLVPFAVFVWRGMCYSAVAESRFLSRNEPFAYIAAPGRIRALQAILSADEMRGLRYPREAWASLRLQLPELPANGFDFRKLTSISPVFTSKLTEHLRSTPLDRHLAYVAKARKSPEAQKLRKNWGEMLYQHAGSCSVGNQIVQIISDVTVNGDLHQTIQATAAAR